jgi:hypothetical protein
MSPDIAAMTLVLMALPVGFLIAALAGARFHAIPCVMVIVIYVWIWLRCRPSRFAVLNQSLEVIWPLKRRMIARDSIARVRLLDREKLKQEIGWGMRIGAGGLGGGFGWLWTKRYGLVHMYISRSDGFVWIERKSDRPYLLTPDKPELFVRALSA